MYYTRIIQIPNYDWKVTIFEPSVHELIKLSDATGSLSASIDNAKYTALEEALLPLIKEWDCTDRQGNLLPIKDMAQLPHTVLLSIAQGIFASVRGQSDPKVDSALSPTSPPATVVTP